MTTYQAIGVDSGRSSSTGRPVHQWTDRERVADEADLVVAIGFDQVEPMPFRGATTCRWCRFRRCRRAPRWCRSRSRSSAHSHACSTVSSSRLPRGGNPTRGTASRCSAIALSATTTGDFGPLELVEELSMPRHAHDRDRRRRCPLPRDHAVLAGRRAVAIVDLERVGDDGLCRTGRDRRGIGLTGTAGCLHGGRRRIGHDVRRTGDIARLRLPVTVVVFDDAALSLIEIKQKPGQGGAAAVRFAPVDYAQVAAAMGLDSVVVTSAVEATRRWQAGGTRHD